MIDEKGRCCGRKPITYKRQQRLFCPRCDRAYSLDAHEQVENWAWAWCAGGWCRKDPLTGKPMIALMLEAKS